MYDDDDDDGGGGDDWTARAASKCIHNNNNNSIIFRVFRWFVFFCIFFSCLSSLLVSNFDENKNAQTMTPTSWSELNSEYWNFYIFFSFHFLRRSWDKIDDRIECIDSYYYDYYYYWDRYTCHWHEISALIERNYDHPIISLHALYRYACLASKWNRNVPAPVSNQHISIKSNYNLSTHTHTYRPLIICVFFT